MITDAHSGTDTRIDSAKWPLFAVLCLMVLVSVFPGESFADHIRPESILGDYRSAPEFGKDAIGQSIRIQIENQKFNPALITVPLEQNIQFIISNIGESPHYLAITRDPEGLKANPEIKKEIEKLTHRQYVPGGGRGHTHSGNNDTEGSAMVRLPEENPRLFVPAGETKEMMFRLNQREELQLVCLMPGHQMRGIIRTEDTDSESKKNRAQGK